MRQALVIAAVCEFGGSVLLGGEVTRTVASGIAKLSAFELQPELYMYGMLCALTSSGTWLIIATYLELPVSTTHSIAGAVLGFAFVFGGPGAVVWLEPQSEFPYMRGMVPIVVSWFVSPLLSGLATALMFLIVRTAILRRERSLELTFWALPVLVMFTVFINVYFVLHKGADTRIVWSSNKCAWVAACAAAACTLLTTIIVMPLVRQYVNQDIEARRRQQLSELECHMRVSERCSRAGGGSAGGGLANGGGVAAGSGSGGRASRAASAGGSGYPLSSHSRGLRSGGPSAGGAAAGAEQELGAGGAGAVTGRPQAAGRPTGHPHALPPLPVRSARSPYGSFTRSVQGAVAAISTDRVVPHPLDPPSLPPPSTHVQERHLVAAPPPLPLRGGSPPPPPIPESDGEDAAAVGGESVAAAPPPLAQTSGGRRRSSSSSAPSHHHQRSPPRQQIRIDRSGSGGDGAGSSGPQSSIGTSSTASVPQADVQTHVPLQAPPAAMREGIAHPHRHHQPQHQSQQIPQQPLQQHQPQQRQPQQNQEQALHYDASLQPQPELLQQQFAAAALGGQQQQQMLQMQQLWAAPHQLQQQQQWLLLQQQLQQQQQQQQQLWLLQQQQQEHQRLHDKQPSHQPHQPHQPHQLHAAVNGGSALPYQICQLPPALQQQQQLLQLEQQWQAQHFNNQQLWGQLQQQQLQQQQLQQQQLQQQQLFQQQQEEQQQPWRPGHVPSGQQTTANGHNYPELAASVGGAGGQYSLDTYGSRGTVYGGVASRRLSPPGPIAESLEWGQKSVPDGEGKKVALATALADGGQAADGGGGGGGAGGVAQWQETFDQLKAIVLHGTNVDVHEAIIADQVAQCIHAHAEVFDPATEDAFKYLQVVTAICDSFSHGANDVANSVGPFTAIWFIYLHQRIDYMAELPIWILVLGGAGIVVGLGTYGYNIIRAIGVRLSAITPSRGFCIELSTAVVVAVASKYGLPISTTHCQVGATAGMGLMEGSSGLHWRLSLQFFLGWVVTLLITGLLSAALFAAGSYAPCIQQSRAIIQYETALLEMTSRIDLLLNRTNFAASADPGTWGNFSAALNDSIAAAMAVVQLYGKGGSPGATRPVQTIDPGALLGLLNNTVSSYFNNSAPYIGGMAAQGLTLPRRP